LNHPRLPFFMTLIFPEYGIKIPKT
jgi:hypothetical protein